ncbi:MAG: hypothetical protein ACFBWO_03375 [Paracoccaceae bacterium]
MTAEKGYVEPVLKALAKSKSGYLTTGAARLIVKGMMRLDEDDRSSFPSRLDQKADQKIRNLKSHRRCVGNPIFEGLMKSLPGGFAITRKGREYLRAKGILL